MSKYFIDTEFIEGTQKSWFGKNTKPTIDLISIGIVGEDGRKYYAISKDFNLKEAWNRWEWNTDKATCDIKKKNYWIRENVLFKIYTDFIVGDYRNIFEFSYSTMKWILKTYGKSNKQIAKEIKDFVLKLHPKTELPLTSYIIGDDSYETSLNNQKIILKEFKDKPVFYGYYADYDWVAFCWLFGKMIDLPKDFPMYCIDVKQMLNAKVLSLKNWCKGWETFDLETRIKIIEQSTSYPKQINEHNALADAKWTKQLYDFICTDLKIKHNIKQNKRESNYGC